MTNPQQFFTARELAEIARSRDISGFPHSERGVQLLAKTQGWDAASDHLCRKRAGRGGGREYHYTLLPEVMRAAMESRSIHQSVQSRLGALELADRARMDALKASALSPDARKVMEARSRILSAIDGYAVANHQLRAWAIGQFLMAQTEFRMRQEIEACRDEGRILTEREVAMLRQAALLTRVDGFQLKPDLLAVANDRKSGAAIGRSAIYDWFKARDERGVVALSPAPTKVAAPIPAGFYDFAKFWAVPSKPSVAKAHEAYLAAMAGRTGTQPMTLTVDQCSRIIRHKLKGIDRYVGREGVLTLRSRMAYVIRKTDGMWPSTIYTADGKTFDAEVADPTSRHPMRPEITSVLDVATRKCVGYAVSRKENVIAVTEALRRSCVANGVCAIFYTDRGGGYKNKTFDADAGGLMGRLGITKMHALPYNSQAKGIIERFNHVWNDLAKEMPTYIGRDMDKEAAKAIHKETRRDIREFGVARRLPSWDSFIEAVEQTIARYNDRPHDGLPKFEDPTTGKRRHMSPNEAWASHVALGFEPITIDPAEEDDLFRPYVMRTASRAQVQWETNTYFHPDLERYHGERVMVGYDQHQADKVWVREFDPDSGDPGKLICVAIFEGNATQYVPLTATQKALETRNRAAIGRLQRKISDKQAELDAPFLLDHEPMPAADFIDVTRFEPEAVGLVVDNTPGAVEPSPAPVRRKTFASDEELAAWALAHPDQLRPTQIAVLQRCLSRPISRENLRANGIDTEALRNLLRAAAA